MSIYSEECVEARQNHLAKFIDNELETNTSIETLVQTLIKRVRQLYVDTIVIQGFNEPCIEAVAMCPLKVLNLSAEMWGALRQGGDEKVVDACEEVITALIRAMCDDHAENLHVRVKVHVNVDKPRIEVGMPVKGPDVWM